MWMESGGNERLKCDLLARQFGTVNICLKTAKNIIDLNQEKPYNISEGRWRAIIKQIESCKLEKINLERNKDVRSN